MSKSVKKRHLIKSFMFVMLCLCVGCQMSADKSQPSIGMQMSNAQSQKAGMEMVSSGVMADIYTVYMDELKYSAGVDKRNSVIYISTQDDKFRTSEGLGMGADLQDVLDHSTVGLVKEAGWAYYVKLESGWNAAFIVGTTMTEEDPPLEAKVSWFFKR